MTYRHILDVDSLSKQEFLNLLGYGLSPLNVSLKGRLSAALLFEKPSNRTRHSMETAINKLEGFSVYVRKDEVDIGQRESIEDVTRTLACYHSVIAARVFSHTTLIKMAEILDLSGSSSSVVNLLSDYSHPQQAIADVLTIHSELKKRGVSFELSAGELESNKSIKVVYIGDFNNVTISLLKALTYLECSLVVCTPKGYGPSEDFIATHGEFAKNIVLSEDIDTAVSNADVLYTDTWVSMGQEEHAKDKLKDFAGFGLNTEVMAKAKQTAIFMHCLPAHRGFEVTDELIDSSFSVVFQQAAMRQNAAIASLLWLFKDQNTGEVKWP